MHKTTTVMWAALAVPCLTMLGGCSFDPEANHFFGKRPRSAAFFCDFERGRVCATQADLTMGIDLAKPDEQGFWAGRSSTYGLDYSPEATAQCGGMPVKVLFEGPFPDGLATCANPKRFDVSMDGPDDWTPWASVEEACRARHGPDTLSRPSHRAADGPFLNACTDAGTLRADFKDPRRIGPLAPVTWVNTVGVAVNASVLTKTAVTTAYDAGAAASAILVGGSDGVFEFTATETDKARTAGFAKGALPDLDPSDADIFYAVALLPGGVLRVIENAQTKAILSYAPGDRLRIGVLGGVVHYFKNGVLLAMGSSPGNTVLRVSVSLRDVNATITNAAVTF